MAVFGDFPVQLPVYALFQKDLNTEPNGRIVGFAKSFLFKQPVFNYSAYFFLVWYEFRFR